MINRDTISGSIVIFKNPIHIVPNGSTHFEKDNKNGCCVTDAVIPKVRATTKEVSNTKLFFI